MIDEQMAVGMQSKVPSRSKEYSKHKIHRRDQPSINCFLSLYISIWETHYLLHAAKIEQMGMLLFLQDHSPDPEGGHCYHTVQKLLLVFKYLKRVQGQAAGHHFMSKCSSLYTLRSRN